MKKLTVLTVGALLWAAPAMALTPAANAPRINVQGTEVAIWATSDVVGDFLVLAELTPNGWQQFYMTSGTLGDTQQRIDGAGGAVAYIKTLLPQINAALARRFPPDSKAQKTGNTPIDGLNAALINGFQFVVSPDGKSTTLRVR